MDTLIDQLRPSPRPGPNRCSDDELPNRIWEVLRALNPPGRRIERRSRRRYPYPYLIRLTPVDDDGRTPKGDPLVVVGKHLSEQGLGFYHPKPLAHRRMLASLETPDGDWLRLLIDVTWCRFTRQGWYESGGRFLQAVRMCEASSGPD